MKLLVILFIYKFDSEGPNSFETDIVCNAEAETTGITLA